MTGKCYRAAYFVFLAVFLCGLGARPSAEFTGKKNTNLERVLIQINQEVCELGFRDNEDFIKREFHFELDGREDNREEHVVVISHPYYNYTRFIMQVTYFEAGVRIGSGRSAREFKEVCGSIKGDHVEIIRNSFTPEESGFLFPAILTGIQEEKKLYGLIKK
jgi:hypothetical protein